MKSSKAIVRTAWARVWNWGTLVPMRKLCLGEKWEIIVGVFIWGHIVFGSQLKLKILRQRYER